ncbi:MAG: protein kinase [Planctomycetes bacterium]|nr:protein kinase [Planctomycetota bacterium]
MAHFDFARRRLTCKVVYCGPGLAGKTTNLEAVHAQAPAGRRGELCSVATQGDRTLFFDYLPLELGRPGGLTAKLMLYTVPGQATYASTRTLVLAGADGIVFVADSDPARLDDNVEALAELRRNVAAVGLSLDELPLVFQWNKRDLPGALPTATLRERLEAGGLPAFEAVAARAEGVAPTLQEITRLVLARCEDDLRRPCPAALDEPPPAPAPPPAPDEDRAAQADLRARPTLLESAVPEPAPEPAAPEPLAPARDAVPRGLLLGQVIGGCRILAKLGEGGMGAVYLARHEMLGKDVVVKVLKPELARQPRRVERFLLEARAAARVEHDNVVRVHDVGTTDDGLHYIVMQRVEGTDLERRIRERGPHDPDEATRLVLAVARALEALHAAGLVHRDVKAENVVVTPSGEVKLIDFGLVKDLTSEANLTRPGALIGTPAYIAPEVGRAATIDGRADIYSLGLTYYHLLTGRAPFAGCEVHDVIFGRARLRRPEALNPAVRPGHRRALGRMIARDRDRRHPDAGALVRDLEALLAGAALDVAEDDAVWAARTPARGERRASSGRQRAARGGMPTSGPSGPSFAEVARALADPSRRVGGHVLLEVLDAAGPGLLHRGWDLARGAPALVRTLDRGRDRLAPAAERALAAARRLRHPALAPLLDHGVVDGRLFVTWDGAEAAGARTLEALAGTLAPAQVARVGHDLAAALAHAHERGVVHGALTPASVLVLPGGRALLLDLGLSPAEGATPLGRARLGARLERAGCPDPDDAGPQGDVRALGAALWRALVGRPPSGGSAASAAPTAASSAPDLLAICRRAREGGYADATDLARDLDRLLQGEPPRARERSLVALARRSPRVAVAGAMTLSVVVGMLLGSAWRAAATSDAERAEARSSEDTEGISSQGAR